MSFHLNVRVSEELFYPLDTEKLETCFPADLPNIAYARMIADNDATVELTKNDGNPLVQFSGEREISSLFCFIYTEENWGDYLFEILESTECEDIFFNRLDLVSELLSEPDVHLRDVIELFEEIEPAKVQKLIDRNGMPKVFRDRAECVWDYMENRLDENEMYYFDHDGFFSDYIEPLQTVIETENCIWVFSY